MTNSRPDWRRSSYCGTNACVEVAHHDGAILIRDSKQPNLPPMVFTAAEWDAFVQGCRAGEFDI